MGVQDILSRYGDTITVDLKVVSNSFQAQGSSRSKDSKPDAEKNIEYSVTYSCGQSGENSLL